MLRLHVKGKAERVWCGRHERLFVGRKCPKCVADKRWQDRRLAQITAVVRQMEELYGKAN